MRMHVHVVCNIVFRANIVRLDRTLDCIVSDQVVSEVDMPGPLLVTKLLDMYVSLIVHE